MWQEELKAPSIRKGRNNRSAAQGTSRRRVCSDTSHLVQPLLKEAKDTFGPGGRLLSRMGRPREAEPHFTGWTPGTMLGNVSLQHPQPSAGDLGLEDCDQGTMPWAALV